MTRSTDLPNEARAFLDAMAIGESGGRDDDAAYSVLFGGSHFAVSNGGWPDGFPQWHGVSVGGNSWTHAAGRYQFEPATWHGLALQHGFTTFDPESQDHAAWSLACEVAASYGWSNNLVDDLTDIEDADLAGLADDLNRTWTSLGAKFPARYRECLARLTPSS